MSLDRNALMMFALGAAVGGITALLLAPEKGQVTRQRIYDRGAGFDRRGAARQWAGAVGDAFAAARETYEHVKNRA